MKKIYDLRVVTVANEVIEFKDILSWSMNDYRLLVATKPSKKEILNEKGIRSSIEFYSEELTFINANISQIKTSVSKCIDDPEELRKHDVFLARGIDMMITDVSGTVEPDVEEVKKQIARDQRGLREKKK